VNWNPYAPPAASVAGSGASAGKESDGGATAAACEAFAGEPYYMRKWRTLLDTGEGELSFNWSAGCFGLTWCFYRKMYVAGLALLGLTFLAAITLGVILALAGDAKDLSDKATAQVLEIATVVTVRIPFGFVANKLYFRKAMRVIGKFRVTGVDGEELLARLRKAGGTSGGGLAIALVLNTAIRLLGL
jgi:hypothetical protein